MSREMERRLKALKRKGWVLEIDQPRGGEKGKEHHIFLVRRIIVIAGPHPTDKRLRNPRDNALKAAIEDAER